MSKQKLSIGSIVTARDRSRPVGYQVMPAIVTVIHGADSGVISATGFPPGGNTIELASLPEIEIASETDFGWYWPEKT